MPHLHRSACPINIWQASALFGMHYIINANICLFFAINFSTVCSEDTSISAFKEHEKSAPCERSALSSHGLASAVLSAMAGLTSEFGMGSGDPRLSGSARRGRSVYGRCPCGAAPSRRPWPLHARTWSHLPARTHRFMPCLEEELGRLVALA